MSVSGICLNAESLERCAANEASPQEREHLEQCAICRSELYDVRRNNDLFARVLESQIDDPVLRPTEQPPASIEGYDLLEEIHRGGQGVVYRARQHATSRDVAVKVLLAGAYATERQRRRFEREIELIAILEHPNLVTVYDSGRTSEGWPFFAMQLIDGETLESWGQRHRVHHGEHQRQLAIFTALCRGVGHAHLHGVIHRDLKPANVMIDATEKPSVVDFGLARPLVEDDQAGVTRDGAVLGTLAYAAPEQLSGDPLSVNTRSDVFALGVMLYELLTGRLPQPIGESLAATLETKRQPVPLLRERGIDTDLAMIVATALALEPERRYPSAMALTDDLERYAAGTPISARSDSTWYLLRRGLYRLRIPVSLGAVLVALLLVFSIVLFGMYERARTEADKVRQINIFLEDTLGSIGEGGAASDVTVSELLDESVQWITLALGEQPEVAAAVRTMVGNSYRSLGRYEDAEEQLQLAMAVRRKLFGDHHLQVAQAWTALGLLRRATGQDIESERMLRRGLEIRRDLAGNDSAEVSSSLANLAIGAWRRGDLEVAETTYRESLAIRRALYGDEHPDVAMCWYRIAQIVEEAGDLTAALEHHRKALAIRQRRLHDDHPDLQRSRAAVARLE